RSCRRPTSPGSRRARSTRWSSRSGCECRRARSPGSAKAWTSRSTRSATGRSRALPVPVAGCEGRVVRKALVLAYGVHESGYREVIALDVGEAETEAFWRSFLRSLLERGQVLGCPWQRCSVHFLREALGHARREQQPMLAALLRPIFSADAGELARALVGDALERLRKPLPKVAALLEEAEEVLLAFYAFPADHWPKLRSTNPLERVNREIGRRTDVVGIFPNDKSLIRLAASIVIEQNDEWLVASA